MVFGVKGRMYILLLKWGFGSFVLSFTGMRSTENRRGCADYFKISAEIFCKKLLHFLVGYGMLSVMRLLLSQRLNRFRSSTHCPPDKAQF